jgi:acyl-CoA thioester hydrolase
MSTRFSRTFHARWGDIDFNGHVRNTAYLDMAADARMMYFSENGFSMRRFEELRIGPVIMRDEVEYYRELRLLDPVTVTLFLAGLTADEMRFRLRNEFHTADSELVARVTSSGGWLDLSGRRLTVPPEALARCLREIEKTVDYAEIPSSRG